jgi:hypothetical protein
MLDFIKAHPAEAIAILLAIFNLAGKLGAKLAGKNPEASRILSFFSAVGPDVVDAVSTLFPAKKAPEAK